jgi:hypothetical protein
VCGYDAAAGCKNSMTKQGAGRKNFVKIQRFWQGLTGSDFQVFSGINAV